MIEFDHRRKFNRMRRCQKQVQEIVDSIGAALAAAAVIVGFLAAPAYAQEARKQDTADPTPAETAQFLAEVAKLVHRSSEGLKVRQLTDGTKFIDLEDRNQNVVLAKINADGTISTDA